MPTASAVLAAFAEQLRYEDIPEAVLAKAKLHLLDVLGVALASASLPFAQVALDGVREDAGRGACTVFGFGDRLPPAWAALMNGTLAHGIDYDDTHFGSVVHVSCSVAPTAIACAEAAGVDGRRFLPALILGMESAVRVGLVAPAAFHDRGFHPTGVCGTFACALVAGKIRGLSPPQLADALGLCGSMAAGTMEFLTDGSWSKRLHPGWAAHGGLLAAQLAQRGFRGPRGVFDGRFGLYRTHLGEGDWDLDALTRQLGGRWELLDIGLKPYPCCHFNHAFIDCAAALQGDAAYAPDAIERIECFVAPPIIPVVCEPAAAKRAPQADYEAKFSLPYAVACQLLRGHVDVDDFTDEAIRDPAVLRLARRVDCVPDPDTDFPRHFPGRVRLTLRDGRTVEHREAINRGGAERPLDAATVREKFHRNAARILPAAQADALVAAVDGIDSAASVRPLARLCVRRRRARRPA